MLVNFRNSIHFYRFKTDVITCRVKTSFTTQKRDWVDDIEYLTLPMIRLLPCHDPTALHAKYNRECIRPFSINHMNSKHRLTILPALRAQLSRPSLMIGSAMSVAPMSPLMGAMRAVGNAKMAKPPTISRFPLAVKPKCSCLVRNL